MTDVDEAGSPLSAEPDVEVLEDDGADAREPDVEDALAPFEATLEALRELLSVVLPHVRELDLQTLDPAEFAMEINTSEEKRRLLAEWLHTYFPTRFVGPGVDVEDWLRTEAEAVRTGEFYEEDEDEGFSPRALEELQTLFGSDGRALAEFFTKFRRRSVAPLRGWIVFESVLTMAVAAFEVFLSRVVTLNYRRYPGSLDDTDKEFSLSDLASFRTIEDARDAAIARRVDGFMRGSFDDWKKWFSQRLKLDLDGAADGGEFVREVFQRRHVIVHNDGLVSPQYLEKLPFLKDPPAVGEYLMIEPQYLQAALDDLEVLGVIIGVHAWSKWIDDEAEQAIDHLQDVVYTAMSVGRWGVVRRLTAASVEFPCSAGLEQVLRANYWLAKKRTEGVDAVREEVQSWDTSALGAQFKIGQAALLDDLDSLFVLVPRAIANRDLDIRDVMTWPILSEMRANDRFASFLESVSPSEAT